MHIANGAKVTMENYLVLQGNPVGLTTGNGGGVYISADSAFTMTGGTITGVTVTAATGSGYGGGVYAASGSTFLMKGGTITGNQALRGAGVCIHGNALFTMSGGSIEDNGHLVNTLYAGGVYFDSYGISVQPSHSMTGGTITGNKADKGGGIGLEGVVFTIDGGTISGNQAVGYAGGMLTAWNSKVIINDGVISGNTAGTWGGGIYVTREGTDVTINGGTILGNTAGQAGGGVFVDKTGGGAPSFTMTGGTLAENRAGTYGGGVYISDGGVFTKQPLTENASSGVIYGYSADNPSSNLAKGTLGIETTHGHAVYVESGPKKRETTVLPDQHLDGEEGGWTE
jgi:hypothetical protein